DNVGVDSLVLRGVRRGLEGYELTGNLEDELTGTEFAPQKIPGELKAFSALRLVDMPTFQHQAGASRDVYPVEVEATDRAGNTSIHGIYIGVVDDAPPAITSARTAVPFHTI